MILLECPTIARLVSPTEKGKRYEDLKASLTKALTYIDKRVDFELKKTGDTLKRWEGKQSGVMRNRLGDEAYEERIAQMRARVEELTAQRKKCLLFEDERGLWTHSGLAHRIAKAAKDRIKISYGASSSNPYAWAHPPRYKDRPYQVEAYRKLLDACGEGPCGVELATGAGKSTIIRNLVQHLGLRTIVMAPSTSIARQLYDDLVYHLGDRLVGLYGDGKKDVKQVTVGIDDSLTRVAPGSDDWKLLSSAEVFVADESHLCPAESLAKVCFGLAAAAPYRFFFSATQMRNDGLDLVLDGITGQIVMHKDVKELVDDGYLARPFFKMVKVRTNSTYDSPDANRMTRTHLYYNRVVYETAAKLANQFVSVMKRPVVILVEELEQFKRLLPHLKHPARFAHGPLTTETREQIPCHKDKPCKYSEPESEDVKPRLQDACVYHGAKPKELVEAFNRGDFPILVGTSCISTGTDIQVAEAAIYLQGGKSEIKVRQGVGRETRGGLKGTVFNLQTGAQKVDCVHVDFDVIDPDADQNDLVTFVPHRHARARAKMYDKIYGPVQEVDMLHVL